MPDKRRRDLLLPDVLLAQPGQPTPGMGADVKAADAPRLAYLLTAAMADNTEQAGTILPGDDLSAEWAGYDKRAQRGILTALGAQTKVALELLHDKLGTEIEMDWDSTARVVCSEALAAARELIAPEPGAWTLPECSHCREVIVKAMCSLQIQAYFRLGSTPAMIAKMCREAAGEPRVSAHP